MRFLALPFSLIGLLFVSDLPVFAQRQPLDLVRGLRSNGLPDLALEYLEEVSKAATTPETAVLLPLEYARTWLELAAQETEDGKRTALIAQAKVKLDEFIRANPNHPQTPQANVELARLLSLQGKVTLTRARRIDDAQAKNAEMDRARAEFKKAAEKYASTAVLIQTQLKAMEAENKPLQVRRQMNQFRLRSMIDQGVNLYQMSETYWSNESDDVIKRGDQLKLAKKIFEDIMDKDDKEPLCWVARAWAAECTYRVGEDATKAYQYLLSRQSNTPAASAGIRVARYFGILHPLDKQDKLDAHGKLVKTEKDAADWLRNYPTYRNSQEGLGARYYLAFAKMELGKAGVQKNKENQITGMTLVAKSYFEEAQRIFKELVDTENEYTERSARYRSQILVTIADAEGHGDAPPPESLGSFERCYLMAQVQLARLVQFKQAKLNPPKAEAPPPEKEEKKEEPAPKKKDTKPPKKEAKPKTQIQPAPADGDEAKKDADEQKIHELIQKEEVRRFTNAMMYLEYGLKIVTPKDSTREVAAAQLLLVSCYYQLKMYPQAAVLAEHIARSNPKASKAPTAAINAVSCYDQAQRSSRKHRDEVQKGEDADKQVPIAEAAIKSDTARLLAAAQFMVEKFPAENATDQARHFIGFFLYNRDRKLREAWKVYAEIKPTYSGIQAARYELSNVVNALIYPTGETDTAKFYKIVADRIKEYSTKQMDEIWPRSLALLEATPVPEETCYANEATAYAESRAQLIRLYQLVKQHDKALAIADKMLTLISKFTQLSAEAKTNLTRTFQTLTLNSVHSIAIDQFKANNYAKVAELVNHRIEEIKKNAADTAKEEPSVSLNRLRAAQRLILTLALQSSVQDQKIERAGEILDVLEKLGGASENNSTAMLSNLLGTVLAQIDDLEKEKKTAEVKSLKQGFQKLLDKVKDRAGGKLDQLPNGTKLFLAKGYLHVDAYQKATEMLESIHKSPVVAKPAPVPDSASDEVKAKYEQAKAAFDKWDREQHQVQYLMARNYRLGKDYPQALKVLSEIIGPKVTAKNFNPKDPKDKGWGFSSLEVRKERALILEEIARTASPSDEKRQAKWGAAVQEWKAITNTFAPQLKEVPSLLTPDDKAMYKTPEQREARAAELEAALPIEKRQQRSNEVTAIMAKRNLYFELYFETTRCSVEAYHNLGVAVVKGNQDDYQAKFAKFAGDFHDYLTKNKDLSTALRDKTHELIESIPLLKSEFAKVAPAGK